MTEIKTAKFIITENPDTVKALESEGLTLIHKIKERYYFLNDGVKRDLKGVAYTSMLVC